MKRGIQILQIMAGVCVTAVIAVLTFFLPKWLFDMYDSRVFGRQEQVKLELASYEKTGSLEEQLRSIELCSWRDDFTISAVRMDEESMAFSDEEVAQIVFQELNKLVDLGVLDMFEQMPRAALVERKLYTAYITGPLNNAYGARDAITFWKLRYEWYDQKNEGEALYTLEVVLDMEYHKLYDIKISGELYTTIYNECIKLPAKKRESYLSDNMSYGFVENMINYYGIRDKAYVVDVNFNMGDNAAKSVSGIVYDANVSSDGSEDEMGLEVQQSAQLSCRWTGYVEFIQDLEEEASTGLLLFIEYGNDGEQGFMHIGLDGLQELLKLE